MRTLTKPHWQLLAKFFIQELANDPVYVGEWLDNQSFADGEDPDSFIELIAAIANE